MPTIADLKKGQKAKVLDISSDFIPLKLLEMGCLPGNDIQLVQNTPFRDPLYLNINDSYVAIRKETAIQIEVEIIS
ncbi:MULTISPECIES: FeoA family protein [Psychroflexus]|uniref:Ferrous iron transport protein A n=1 Tax=Psychroflexus halocasei TaxID=908615 RepID=A0A1H4CJW0_9FLAO|nr:MULTISPECIES: FeoA family protein [Psychroflexus]MDN6311187.1 ferrous iron transport protein A [Psychroflexus sp.]SEA60647.1 ferrous iron transport protein A [Psychroflexus halocasei]